MWRDGRDWTWAGQAGGQAAALGRWEYDGQLPLPRLTALRQPTGQ